jgi:hypothetical protein
VTLLNGNIIIVVERRLFMFTNNFTNYDALINTLNSKKDEQFGNSVKRVIHNVAYLIHLDEQNHNLNTYQYSRPELCIYKEEIAEKRERVAFRLAKQLRWLNSQCKVIVSESFINTFIPLDNVDEIVEIALSVYSITGKS